MKHVTRLVGLLLLTGVLSVQAQTKLSIFDQLRAPATPPGTTAAYVLVLLPGVGMAALDAGSFAIDLAAKPWPVISVRAVQSPAAQDQFSDNLTAAAGQTVFVGTFASLGAVDVYRNGVLQRSQNDYTLSADTNGRPVVTLAPPLPLAAGEYVTLKYRR